MKANTNKKNKSASRKLVPAVAMLTTSAVMLSSATYAWFTLNKEVEVTGLSMSATASDALEISLGARGTTSRSTTITKDASGVVVQPSDKDVSWTNNELISSYYKEVGKLKPASSANAINLFYAKEVTAGGRYADTFDTATDTATLNLNDSEAYIKGNENGIATLPNDSDSGYYIDVPVWLRTSKLDDNKNDDVDDTNIYCAVKIARKSTVGANLSANDQLYKAVRVAFLPTTATADGEVLNAPTTSGDRTVFGVSTNTYDDNTSDTGKVDGKVIGGTGARSTALTTPNPEVKNDVASGDTYLTSALAAKIPYATADTYGRQQFIVRIWLEGEDVNCWDLTSNQDWSIDFAFSLSEFKGDNQPTFKTVNANPGP